MAHLLVATAMGPGGGRSVSTSVSVPGANMSDCGTGGGLGCGWAALERWTYTSELAAGTYTFDLAVLATVAMEGSGIIARGNNWYDAYFPDDVLPVICATIDFWDDPSCADWNYGDSTCDVEANHFWAKTFHQIVTTDGLSFPASNSGGLKCDPPPPEEECDDDDDSYDDEEWATYCENDGGGGGGGGWELVCSTEWIKLEISYDGGNTWSTLWEGWGEVCEYMYME
jgi:hypothetical protein